MSDYNVLAKLRRSSIKIKILKNLDEPKTATDLKKILNVHRESISRALIEMEKDGLVACANPEQPNYRYYKLTSNTKKLVDKLNN